MSSIDRLEAVVAAGRAPGISGRHFCAGEKGRRSHRHHPTGQGPQGNMGHRRARHADRDRGQQRSADQDSSAHRDDPKGRSYERCKRRVAGGVPGPAPAPGPSGLSALHPTASESASSRPEARPHAVSFELDDLAHHLLGQNFEMLSSLAS
jgi:hypothetical protein